MSARSRTPPRRTTAWGGCGLAVVAVLGLLAEFGVSVPITETSSIPFAGRGTTWVASVLLLAASGVLAFGVRGESGIAGRSARGRTALVVFGAGDIFAQLLDLLMTGTGAQAIVIQTVAALGVLVGLTIATVVAAVDVARAGVIEGVARWALVPVAACAVLLTGLQTVQLPEAALTLLEWHVGLVRPGSLLIAGGASLLHGRAAALRRWVVLTARRR